MTDDLVAGYLARLEATAAVLGPAGQAELVAEIRGHIDDAREAGELSSEAATRELLDRLGEPDEIVAAARSDLGESSQPPIVMLYRPPSTIEETVAFLLMTVGSIIPLIGWLIGVIVMWTSRRLTTAEKLLATLVFPGGPAIVVFLSGPVGFIATTRCTSYTAQDSTGALISNQSCTGLSHWLTAAMIGGALILLLLPVGVAITLLRRVKARAALEPPIPYLATISSTSKSRAREIAAVLLLTIGTFALPLIGPFVGVVLAWASRRWSTADKWIATGLWAASSLAFFASSFSNLFFSVSFGAFLAMAVGGPLAGVYLAIRLWMRPGLTTTSPGHPTPGTSE